MMLVSFCLSPLSFHYLEDGGHFYSYFLEVGRDPLISCLRICLYCKLYQYKLLYRDKSLFKQTEYKHDNLVYPASNAKR